METDRLIDEQTSIDSTGWIESNEATGKYGYTFIYDGVVYSHSGYKDAKAANKAAQDAITEVYNSKLSDAEMHYGKGTDAYMTVKDYQKQKFLYGQKRWNLVLLEIVIIHHLPVVITVAEITMAAVH